MCESYEKAALPLESKLRFAVCTLTAGCSVGLLFYDRIAAALLLSVLLLGFFPLYRERERKKRQDALLLQFRDVLYARSSSVSAGRPMTEGLAEAENFCGSTYTEQDDIMRELTYMRKRIQQSGEDDLLVLRDFAARSGLSDIADFVNVYEICRESGGDLSRAMNRAASIIGDKIQLEAELKALMAQKAFESRIVAGAPFAMVLLMRVTAPSYMRVMYETSSGLVITSISLLLIACAFWLMERINQIEI